MDSTGKVGTVEHAGYTQGGACYGSAAAACGYVLTVHSGEIEPAASHDIPLDAQQTLVGSLLLPYAGCLAAVEELMIKLPLA
jgi:hypothetical protein